MLVGYVEDREGTRSLVRLGGLGRPIRDSPARFASRVQRRSDLPGLAGFVGELVMLTGVYQAGYVWPAIVGLVAVVLAAAYFLRLYQGIMNGPGVPDLPVRADLTWLEGLAVAPLLAALVLVGVQPHAILTAFAVVAR